MFDSPLRHQLLFKTGVSRVDVFLVPLLNVCRLVVGLYTWLVIAAVISNWLIVFGIINVQSPVVRMILDFIFRLTDPILSRVRAVVPFVGGIDLSPLILLLGLYFVQEMLGRILLQLLL